MLDLAPTGGILRKTPETVSQVTRVALGHWVPEWVVDDVPDDLPLLSGLLGPAGMVVSRPRRHPGPGCHRHGA